MSHKKKKSESVTYPGGNHVLMIMLIIEQLYDVQLIWRHQMAKVCLWWWGGDILVILV